MKRPCVYSTMPTYGACHPYAAISHYASPTGGECSILPTTGCNSLLAYGFNIQWSTALDWHKADMVDYFLMHHADVHVLTPGWLDLMIREMKRVGAAVLGTVIPLKEQSGLTSTAVETDDPWHPRKLNLKECWSLPETFCNKDLDTGRALLVNTGLLLIDLGRPEFYEVNDAGELNIFFTIDDRIVRKESGEHQAQVKSEDWNFSRLCHVAGLPVYATRAVQVDHYGDFPFRNYPLDDAK